MVFGGKSFDSMTPEEQTDSRARVLEARIVYLERANARLEERNKALTWWMGRDKVEVMRENERVWHEIRRFHLHGPF